MAEVKVNVNVFPSEPTPTTNSSVINEKVSMPANGKYYDTTNVKRGIALVFNHRKFEQQSEREGTDKDKNNIAQTLKGLKFDVRVYDDLTVKHLRGVLNEVAGEDHSKNDCLMVVVMSHGEQGTIHARDTDYKAKELWETFASDKCRSLIGKPKLFFIQACRGVMVDDGVTYSKSCGEDEVDGKTEISTPSKFFIPQLPDLFVVFSTFDGYTSFRNERTGSWFIQSLCREFIENAEKDSLQDLILGITRRVAYDFISRTDEIETDQKKQIPTTLSTLTKRFYFKKNE